MVKILGSNRSLLLPIFLFAHSLFGSQPPLSAAKENQPDDAITLLKKATESIKVKQYGEALALLNSATEADVGLSEAYWHRASVFRLLCRYEKSEKDYNKFLELQPGTTAAEKELSQLLQAKSALDSAYDLYGSETGYILKEDENNLEALLLRGRAYYYLSDHDVASRHFQKGLRLDPEHSELKKAYFGLKNLLKKTKSVKIYLELQSTVKRQKIMLQRVSYVLL